MISKAPKQITTLPPFVPRDWTAVVKDFSVLFPSLEVIGSEPITNSLKRPLKGEFINYNLLNSPKNSGAAPFSTVLRDNDYKDTGLKVTRVNNAEISISSGSCVVLGCYVEIKGTTTISLTDEDSFVNIYFRPSDPQPQAPYPKIADADYYIGIFPFNGDNENYKLASHSLAKTWNTFAFGLVLADEWDRRLTLNHSWDGVFCKLACITLNGSGDIENDNSITTKKGKWDRELLAYPPGPSLYPLNGGVVIDDNWYDDWI